MSEHIETEAERSDRLQTEADTLEGIGGDASLNLSPHVKAVNDQVADTLKGADAEEGLTVEHLVDNGIVTTDGRVPDVFNTPAKQEK